MADKWDAQPLRQNNGLAGVQFSTRNQPKRDRRSQYAENQSCCIRRKDPRSKVQNAHIGRLEQPFRFWAHRCWSVKNDIYESIA